MKSFVELTLCVYGILNVCGLICTVVFRREAASEQNNGDCRWCWCDQGGKMEEGEESVGAKVIYTWVWDPGWEKLLQMQTKWNFWKRQTRGGGISAARKLIKLKRKASNGQFWSFEMRFCENLRTINILPVADDILKEVSLEKPSWILTGLMNKVWAELRLMCFFLNMHPVFKKV